jgi:hypothetical protein
VVAVLSDVTADVVLLPNDPPTAGRPFAVPFGGSEHDWAAAELAALLARASGTALRMIGALAEHDDASRLVARVGLANPTCGRCDRRTSPHRGHRARPSHAPGRHHCRHRGIRTVAVEGFGSFRQQLVDAAPGTLVIRRGLRPGLLAPPTFGTRFAWSAAG